jgi:uncharacterized protein YbjQ (UPF0145 family)
MDEFLHPDLPPVAIERIRSQAQSKVAGSLLSAPAAAALAAADLVPVGEVMGCIVMHLGWNTAGCGLYYNGTRGLRTPVITSGRRSGYAGAFAFASHTTAIQHCYDQALRRMNAEAAALQAKGVVGVDLRWTRLDSGAQELMALGTAVRDRRPPPGTPAKQPFYTELSGEDVAKAVLAGWTPLGMAIGLAAALKHEDATLRYQRSQLTGPGNVEVDGMTELIHAARVQARQALTDAGRRLGSAAQIVISRNDLRVGEQPCGEEVDFRAEATFVGTALTYDPLQAKQTSKGSLSILPLRSRGEGTRPTGARR